MLSFPRHILVSLFRNVMYHLDVTMMMGSNITKSLPYRYTHFNLSDEELELYSLENHVKSETAAPMFAFHTSNDQSVPVASPLLLALAYAKVGLPFELHIYPCGPHGIALANEATSLGNPLFESEAVATWLGHSIEWIKNI